MSALEKFDGLIEAVTEKVKGQKHEGSLCDGPINSAFEADTPSGPAVSKSVVLDNQVIIRLIPRGEWTENAGGVALQDAGSKTQNLHIGYVVGFGPMTGNPITFDPVTKRVMRPVYSSQINGLKVGRKVTVRAIAGTTHIQRDKMNFHTCDFLDIVTMHPQCGYADANNEIVEVPEPFEGGWTNE